MKHSHNYHIWGQAKSGRGLLSAGFKNAVYDLNKNIIEIEINQNDMKQNRNN